MFELSRIARRPRAARPTIAQARLAALTRALAAGGSTPQRPIAGRTQRLVERWLPVAGQQPQKTQHDEPEPELVEQEPGEQAPALPVALPKARAGWVTAAWVAGVLGAAATVLVLVLRGAPEPERAPALPPAPGVGSVSRTVAAESSAAEQAELVVSVVGKVAKPGLVRIKPGARVADVIEAAGGAKPGTDLTSLNLARTVADGEQVHVGVPQPPAAAGGEPAAGSEPAPLDLNAATSEQLQTLPGVGEVTARRILDWRAQHGSFTAVEQLREIEGIGERRLAALREYVVVPAGG